MLRFRHSPAVSKGSILEILLCSGGFGCCWWPNIAADAEESDGNIGWGNGWLDWNI